MGEFGDVLGWEGMFISFSLSLRGISMLGDDCGLIVVVATDCFPDCPTWHSVLGSCGGAPCYGGS